MMLKCSWIPEQAGHGCLGVYKHKLHNLRKKAKKHNPTNLELHKQMAASV